MRKIIFIIGIVFTISLFSSGCNIVPKSVQYQEEEKKLLGPVDVINPVLEEIQVVLKGLGYDPGNTDGRMGQETRDAIKDFQESMAIKGTGYIDEVTLTQIEEIRRSKEEHELKGVRKVEVRSAYPGKEGLLPTGFKPTTKEIQKALKNAGFDPGTIDGKMGPKTKQAVKEFQKTKGLKVDGVVGPKTWAELGRYLKVQP